MKLNPNSPTRYRFEKYFWYVQIPIAAGLYFFAGKTWQHVSILYIALLSIWALGSTADGNEEAAKAAEAVVNDDTD